MFRSIFPSRIGVVPFDAPWRCRGPVWQGSVFFFPGPLGYLILICLNCHEFFYIICWPGWDVKLSCSSCWRHFFFEAKMLVCRWCFSAREGVWRPRRPGLHRHVQTASPIVDPMWVCSLRMFKVTYTHFFGGVMRVKWNIARSFGTVLNHSQMLFQRCRLQLRWT